VLGVVEEVGGGLIPMPRPRIAQGAAHRPLLQQRPLAATCNKIACCKMGPWRFAGAAAAGGGALVVREAGGEGASSLATVPRTAPKRARACSQTDKWLH
jgi:hypothetical protein